MRIFSKATLTTYSKRHTNAREELLIWYAQLSAADWKDFNALRADLPATDYIGNDRFVFNVKGNHYRLIAMIFFGSRTVFIRGIFTHAEYTKLCKDQQKLLAL